MCVCFFFCCVSGKNNSQLFEIECENDDSEERKGQKPVTNRKWRWWSSDGWYSILLFTAMKTISWGFFPLLFKRHSSLGFMRINKQEMLKMCACLAWGFTLSFTNLWLFKPNWYQKCLDEGEKKNAKIDWIGYFEAKVTFDKCSRNWIFV